MRSRGRRALEQDAAPLRRFFIDDRPDSSDELALRGDLAHRLTRVLRLGPGDAVELFDGSGSVWTATITTAKSGSVSLTVGSHAIRAAEPSTILAAALIRPNRFDWLVEKATELGMTELRPLVTARSAVRPAEIGATRLERWRRLAIEAAEQCGRVTVPTLHPPVDWSDVLGDLAGSVYVAAEPSHGEATPLGSVLRGLGNDPVTIIIGPEGGLTSAEIAEAVSAGVRPVSLGPLVLRAETAAIAALAIIADARGR